MDLLRNTRKGSDWLLEGEVYCRLFERYIRFVVEDEASIEYVAKCGEYMNSWDAQIVERICEACVRYCNDFSSMIGAEPVSLSSSHEILALVSPSVFLVPNRAFDEPVAHLELNCEWEEEHGMEWIVRGRDILYVGGFNGQDPWRSYVPKTSYNYA